MSFEVGAIHYRVVVIGEAAVGKTSISKTFADDGPIDKVQATIGAAFLSQSVYINDMRIKFDIWDTAGQERYQSLTPMYYRGAHGAIIVYDITDRRTFDRAIYWIQQLRKQTDLDIVVCLCGNKTDLKQKRKITSREGQTLAESNGLMFMETSAKTGENVRAMFITVAKAAFDNVAMRDSIISRSSALWDHRISLLDEKEEKKHCKCSQ